MPRRTNREELPDVDIVLTKEEREALREVKSAEARWLYLEISFRRDFATNISGEATRINDGALKESLSYKGSRGKKSYKPSSTHVMRWLDQLENVGLIKRLGNHVFYLPLAPIEESVKILSHQFCHQYRKRFVTEFVTSEENKKEHIYIQKQEEKKESVSTFVTKNDNDLSQQVDTPLITTLHNITFTGAKGFFDLLTERNFPYHYIANKKTIAMIKVWIEKGITVEDARIGLQHCDSRLEGKPAHPTYYLKPVIQYTQDLIAARTKAENLQKVNDEQRTHAHKQSRQLSKNDNYWENMRNPPLFPDNSGDD